LFDGVRVRQCLTNLVSNALKFTTHGKVEVGLACYPDREGRIRVRLRVSDTGIGMNEATVAKLFRPFTQADASTTRNFGGTGLGLNITRRLVELMRGEINGRERGGRGSVFTIEMLVDAAEPSDVPVWEDEAGDEEAGFAALQGRRVLVVDDHPVNRRVIRLFLEPFECELIEAENGQQALDALDARADRHRADGRQHAGDGRPGSHPPPAQGRPLHPPAGDRPDRRRDVVPDQDLPGSRLRRACRQADRPAEPAVGHGPVPGADMARSWRRG
jgi:CheY-like chemotaxis protein